MSIHQTAIFIEISTTSRDEYRSRVMRLIDSVNRADTIKADIYFVTNGKIHFSNQGLESSPELVGGVAGDMSNLDIQKFAKQNKYNMHLVVSDPYQEPFVADLDPTKITELLKDI